MEVANCFFFAMLCLIGAVLVFQFGERQIGTCAHYA
jgi:hypothetical protein